MDFPLGGLAHRFLVEIHLRVFLMRQPTPSAAGAEPEAPNGVRRRDTLERVRERDPARAGRST